MGHTSTAPVTAPATVTPVVVNLHPNTGDMGQNIGQTGISLMNLEGVLQNLCDGSDCNQMFLQNLAVPIGVPVAKHMGVPAKLSATMPSAAHMGIPVAHHAKPIVVHHAKPVVHHVKPVVHHAEHFDNVFHTQNIDVNQIDSAGNVDIKLMNLYEKMHVAPKVEVKSMVDWCYKNDSDKARTICPQHAALKAAGHKAVVMPVHHAAPAMHAAPVLAHDVFHTQNIDVNQIDSAGNVDISLMNLGFNTCDYKGCDNYSPLQNLSKVSGAVMPSAAHMGIPVAHHAKPVVVHHAKPVVHHVVAPVVTHAAPAALTHDVFHTQNIDVNQIDSAKNVVISLQNLCDGSDCNQMFLI